MTKTAANPFPNITRVSLLSLDAISEPLLLSGITFWAALCGVKSIPGRSQINPRDIAPFLANISIIKVIDGGVDFEHRIVGDIVARAYRVKLNDLRLSELALEAPVVAQHMTEVFRHVFKTRRPCAVHAVPGHDRIEVNFVDLKAVVLPLGEHDGPVDHLITFNQFAF